MPRSLYPFQEKGYMHSVLILHQMAPHSLKNLTWLFYKFLWKIVEKFCHQYPKWRRKKRRGYREGRGGCVREGERKRGRGRRGQGQLMKTRRNRLLWNHPDYLVALQEPEGKPWLALLLPAPLPSKLTVYQLQDYGVCSGREFHLRAGSRMITPATAANG